jgi:RNA polymerase-binding protein DksA
MSRFNTSEISATLKKEREHLVHQLEELGAAESGDLRADLDFGGSFADAASITAERTEVLGLVDSIKGQLDDVDAALARLDSGDYGTCASCGKEISIERLEARPASILCVECKSRAAS